MLLQYENWFQEYLDIAAKTFAKINPKNVPEIERLLGTLNLKLANFISDPSIFIQFFGDPAKGAILLEVQKLLPLFDPADINAILTIKIQFDKAMPGDNAIYKFLRPSVIKIIEVRFNDFMCQTFLIPLTKWLF